MKIFSIVILTICFCSANGQTTPCNCEKYDNRSLDLYTELQFSNNGLFNSNWVEKWEDQTKCDKIKSIYFLGFDSVPKEFIRFRNVEKVRIVGITNKRNFGLEYFPKLKELIIEECELEITDSTVWLRGLEKLTTNKTKITGLKSFTQLNKLIELDMSFSGFDTFPNDFNKLTQLKYISFGGHTFGKIDLSLIDFEALKRLEYFEIDYHTDKAKGVPKGLSHTICVRVNYIGLTNENKRKLDKFTCR